MLGKCSFEDVFLTGAKFHCFTGTPKVRRKAIEEINEVTAKKETVTKEQLLKELQELFCSDQRLEEQLAEQFKDLNMRLHETSFESSSEWLPPSDVESYPAFDFCL